MTSDRPYSASHCLISSGIDVGTTTTQLAITRLDLSKPAAAGAAGRASITNREVLYRSPVIFTPLSDENTIDAARVAEFVNEQYKLAGIRPAQVESGAAIITGETARKKNAQSMLEALSHTAGDFVVAMAGPHLEGIIAGRGSGAAGWSASHFSRAANLDIGGGTCNLAVFRGGEAEDSAAINAGGRIVRIDPASGTVLQICEPARLVIEANGCNLRLGEAASILELNRLARCLADLIVELICGGCSDLAKKLYLTQPLQSSAENLPLMFSGGVGWYFYHPGPVGSIAEIAAFGDIGPLLAHTLRNHLFLTTKRLITPQETLRATVLGAASQSVKISGSTIWAEKEILPLRNLPVVQIRFPENPEPVELEKIITGSLKRMDVTSLEALPAAALEFGGRPDYNFLQNVAQALLNSFIPILPSGSPLVVVMASDYARALGQCLRLLNPHLPLIIIDQIDLREGDYIDIGRLLQEERAVPVTVKTLVFYH